MQIELTEREAKTLRAYVKGAIIDAEGSAAIGIGSRETVKDLKSVMKKIGGTYDF